MDIKQLTNEEFIERLKDKIEDSTLVAISSVTGVSVGYLCNLKNYPNVFKLGKKLRTRIEESGLLV